MRSENKKFPEESSLEVSRQNPTQLYSLHVEAYA